MNAGGTRARWEARAAKQYRLDRHWDRIFFDTAWELGGFQTTTQTYEEDYEPLIANWVVFWKLRYREQERTRNPREAVLDGGAGSDRDGTLRPRIAPATRLGAADSARQLALAEYLHKTAALDRDVMLFRAQVLGSAQKTLSRAEALRWLEEAEGSRSQTPSLPVALVSLPEGESGRWFQVAEESDCGRLSRLAGALSRKYLWDEAQATAFVLCGDYYSDDGTAVALTPPAVRVGYREIFYGGHVAHPYYRTDITMEAASWVPPEQVKEIYAQKQRELNGGRSQRRPSLRNIEVFRFVLSNADVHVVNAEEHWARLVVPPWRQLREAWDDGFPLGHEWHYGAQNLRNFRRDFGLGQRAVIGESVEGLLGIPWEPQASAERLEYWKRREKALTRRQPPPVP